jgi:transcriptional regulator with XRE-family HTH domain
MTATQIRNLNPGRLRNLYTFQGITQDKIASLCGVAPSTIRLRFKQYGIKKRSLAK